MKRATRNAAAPLLLPLLMSLSGCGLDGGDGAAGLEPRAELAQKAVLSAADQAPGRPASGGKDAATVNLSSSAKAQGEELAAARDPHADHGDGPRYADLRGVTLTDSGERLVVVVDLDQTVPGRLARTEIQDVVVDVYRVSPLDALLGHTDSDYRVHLRGGAQGWRAFLRTPEGYVDFPGAFTVGGRSLCVVLPWDAVGGPKRAVVDVFVDWSSGVGRLTTDGVPRLRLAPE